MGKQPKIFITDGLPTYKTNARRIFPEAKHIRQITLKGEPHNNKMERMNGEISDERKDYERITENRYGNFERLPNLP